MPSMLKGFITGFSDAYSKEETKRRELQEEADRKAKERLEAVGQKKELLEYEYGLKRQNKKAEREAMYSSMGFDSDPFEGADMSDPDVRNSKRVFDAAMSEGKITEAAKAIRDLPNRQRSRRDQEIQETQFDQSQSDRDIEQAETATQLQFSVEQPIDVFRRFEEQLVSRENPHGQYGKGHEASTERLFSRIVENVGEMGRIEGSSKTKINGSVLGRAATQLMRARNDIYHNPLNTADDRRKFEDAFNKLEAIDKEIESITGQEYNPFEDRELFPTGVFKKLDSVPNAKQKIIDTIGDIAGVEATSVSSDGRKYVQHKRSGDIIEHNGKRFRILGVSPEGKKEWVVEPVGQDE